MSPTNDTFSFNERFRHTNHDVVTTFQRKHLHFLKSKRKPQKEVI